MICSEKALAREEACSVGPVAAWTFAMAGVSLRVHSVFTGTVNLEAEGTDEFLALTGPSGLIYPHAVALRRPVDFRAWRLPTGGRVFLQEGSMRLQGESATVVVDLGPAERTSLRPLPLIDRLGAAHRACVARLGKLQDCSGCDLRMDGLGLDGPVATGLGESLRRAALDLGAAARGFAGSPGGAVAPPGIARSEEGKARASLGSAVAALMGLGAGLTPSGDDVLCGFMAAARIRCPELVPALAAAAEGNLQRTSRISGFLIRCAARGCWPAPLVDLAEALAGDRVPEALVALGALGRLGHSSGMDLASGFLFGLETFSPNP